MIKATGVHHLAFSTADMKGQIEFFSDVLGMPLVAIFAMHGVPGGIHAFLEGSPQCLLSFVQLPAISEIEIEYGEGVTFFGPCCGGVYRKANDVIS